MDGIVIGNDRIQVKSYHYVASRPPGPTSTSSYFHSSSDHTPNRGVGNSGRTQYRVTVLGLSDRTSWQDLKDFGRRVGVVNYADVVRTPDGSQRGVLEYQDRPTMEGALRRLGGEELLGRVVKVVPERYYHSSSNGGSGDHLISPPRSSQFPHGGGEEDENAAPPRAAPPHSGLDRRQYSSRRQPGADRSRNNYHRSRSRDWTMPPPRDDGTRQHRDKTHKSEEDRSGPEGRLRPMGLPLRPNNSQRWLSPPSTSLRPRSSSRHHHTGGGSSEWAHPPERSSYYEARPPTHNRRRSSPDRDYYGPSPRNHHGHHRHTNTRMFPSPLYRRQDNNQEDGDSVRPNRQKGGHALTSHPHDPVVGRSRGPAAASPSSGYHHRRH